MADNYEWWIQEGVPLAAEVDLLAVLTYPVWEGKTIAEAFPFTIDNIAGVREALPGKPLAIFEAGWATTAIRTTRWVPKSTRVCSKSIARPSRSCADPARQPPHRLSW